MSDLFRIPEDRFSRDMTQTVNISIQSIFKFRLQDYSLYNQKNASLVIV